MFSGVYDSLSVDLKQDPSKDFPAVRHKHAAFFCGHYRPQTSHYTFVSTQPCYGPALTHCGLRARVHPLVVFKVEESQALPHLPGLNIVVQPDKGPQMIKCLQRYRL